MSEAVGEFILSRGKDGKLWISKVGGEAMELNSASEEKLAQLIAQFWKENF